VVLGFCEFLCIQGSILTRRIVSSKPLLVDTEIERTARKILYHRRW